MNQKTREAVRERDREQYTNCYASGPDVMLDVHHVVSRGQGGSGRLSELNLLYYQCHDAVHSQATAPTVEFSSTGQMNTASFQTFLEFFKRLPRPRFDSDEKVWKVPKADFEEKVVREVSKPSEPAAVANGGKK